MMKGWLNYRRSKTKRDRCSNNVQFSRLGKVMLGKENPGKASLPQAINTIPSRRIYMFRKMSRVLPIVLAMSLLLAVQVSSAQDTKTLKVWHFESENGAMGTAWAAAMKTFEDTHPGVKI